MKNLFSLFVVGLLLGLASCSGGWSDEQLTTLKNDCVMEGKYDCACYVKKAQKTFKNPEEYNKQDSKLHEKFEKEVEACKIQQKDTTTSNAIESF